MSSSSPTSPPSPQRVGYLVVLRPQAAQAAYLAEMRRLLKTTPSMAGWEAWWRALVRSLHGVDEMHYAGWDRDPVGRALVWPAGGSWTRAERLMLERLGEDPNLSWGVDFVSERLIPDLALASQVLAATDKPEDYELVRVVRVLEGAEANALPAPAEASEAETLGLDVGWWGGPFSILSDTMIYPRWHPATDEAMPTLRKYAAALNDNMLFATQAAAMAFRDWYRTQDWAESEPGPFCVARLDRV